MTHRERVLRALNFEETDRPPKDLGGMNSTGISCFAYPDLVRALGLPPRPPRIHDTGQMLALPDLDVLDALDCDVVTVHLDFTNAFPQPELWHPYDFGGRIAAQVRDPGMFRTEADGTVTQPAQGRRMPPESHVFEEVHGGQPLLLTGDIPKPDLEALRANQRDLSETDIAGIAALCKRAREESDRAVFFNGPAAGIGIAAHTGIAMFPMLCLTEPDFVLELHELIVGHAVRQMERLLPAVAPYIDVYMCSSDDWGTQNQTVASPRIFRDLFAPCYARVTAAIHRHAPGVKAFLHTCGAVYDLLDDFAACGFDAVNPVQWTAGGHSYREWKDACRGRMTLWGGGVNTQVTLPLGSLDDVTREAREVAAYLSRDGGFVFSAIHNILAEIPGEKTAALFKAIQ